MKTAIYVNVISAMQLCITTKMSAPEKVVATKHRAFPPPQKIGEHVPLSTHRSMPMDVTCDVILSYSCHASFICNKNVSHGDSTLLTTNSELYNKYIT